MATELIRNTEEIETWFSASKFRLFYPMNNENWFTYCSHTLADYQIHISNPYCFSGRLFLNLCYELKKIKFSPLKIIDIKIWNGKKENSWKYMETNIYKWMVNKPNFRSKVNLESALIRTKMCDLQGLLLLSTWAV